jgi:ATP-dependent helicase HepA
VSESPRYAPGQRWVSTTEPELGLGIVVSADRRFVEVAFAGNEEKRKYGIASAPLRRVTFKTGDAIKDKSGIDRSITGFIEADPNGKMVYACGGAAVSEEDIVATASASPAALQRLLGGINDRCEDFDLRLRLLRAKAEILQSRIRGFAGGRIQLLPHQLSIASEASSRRCVRVLLADETGLGKTIEACLILHRMALTGRVRRCLICVPESLLHQWFVELLRRFNLLFRLFTQEHFDSLGGQADPFGSDQFGIIGMQLLAQDKKLCETAARAGWDMVIVDEAHHLSPGSTEFDCIRKLSDATEHLILLTATPEQAAGRDNFLGLLGCLGVGRVMFRTTRKEVSGFPQRIVHIEPLQAQEAFKEKMVKERERLFGAETAGPVRVSKDDPRLAWLSGLLRANAGEKFLVICSAKEKAIALRDALQESVKADFALFHEDMTLVQRDRNAAWFTEEAGARILVSSEIGSEGRNFQVCRNLVLLDLPLEPELLEQRIGRLDRIGQGSVIHLFIPSVSGTYEESLSRWYHEGLGLFEKNVPAGGMTYQAVRRDLIRVLKDDATTPAALDGLIAETRKRLAEFSRIIEAGGDRSMVVSPYHRQQAAEIRNAVVDVEERRLSARVMEPIFKHYGAVAEEAGRGKWVLLTDYVTDPRFPLPRHERPVITYEREIALLREDIEFVSIDHPMVIDSLDLFLSSDFGTSVAASWEAAGREELLLEAVYMLECVAPESLNAGRFLSPTPIRVMVNQESKDVAGQYPAEIVGRMCKEATLEALEEAPFPPEETLPRMQQAAEARANAAAKPLIQKSLHEMRTSLDAELARLRLLKQIDSTFPGREIDLCEKEKAELEKHLAQSRVRLDSVRVIRRGGK